MITERKDEEHVEGGPLYLNEQLVVLLLILGLGSSAFISLAYAGWENQVISIAVEEIAFSLLFPSLHQHTPAAFALERLFPNFC